MKVIEYCAGICLLLFLTEVTLAKHKKDVIDCGHVFNQSVGSIVNNTLHPNTTCTYIIKPSASKLTGTHLFLKKLLLDGNDNVTISKLNTTEPLFPIFHGQNDAVVLIADATSVQITIQTSSVSNIARHFDAAYDMISETFSFVVDDSISTIQRPLTYDQSWVEVTFVFNARPNVARSFSFELFNLTSSSYVKVTGVENPVSTFSGANRPPDLFSNGQVKIDFKTYPEDKFLLRQFLLDSACSGYLNVSSTAIQLESPIRPVIDNGSMNLECRWFIQSDKPNIEFTIKSIELKSVYDILVITDGPHYDSEPLHQITSSTASQTVGKEIVTNSTTMVVSFKPDSVLSKFTASIRASSGSQNSLPLDVELTAPNSSENLIEKKSKGAITCGYTFNKTTGGVTNNILNHSISCSYHFTPVNGSQPIRLLLKKLILDHDDNVTIFKDKDTKPLFPVLHGQSDAVLLITDSRNITITIDTSNVANTTRHFEAAYDSGAEECTFTVDDDISTIQQPILLGNTSEKCKLSYISHPNIERSFTFEIFNLSAGSTIAVEKVENPNTLKGQKKPPDMFSSDAATFDIDFTPGDHFRLRQYELNSACSKYMKVSGSDTIKTAPMPKYDNGSLNLECRWLIVSGNDNSLEFKLKTINLTNPYDVLSILDGPNFDSPPLHEITSLTAESAKNNVMLTSGQNMMVSFKSSSILSNFEAEVRNADQSKYYKNNGTLSLKSSNTENIWLLEVEPSETVTLIFSSSGFPSPAVLEIYDDFNIKAKQIASLSGNVWYPILSTTSRMMIIAKNFEKGSFTAAFSGSTVGCMRMSQGTSGTYTLSKNCNSTCAWIIPPINATDTDLILDLQFISLDTGDMIEVLQMDDKKTKLATISSGITHIPQLTIKSDVGVYLNITRGSCPKKPTDIVLVAQANYLPKCSGNLTLTPGQEVQLTSPGFPNTYPLLADCKWAISTSPPHQFIHVVFNELQLAENHCVILRENTSAPIKLSGNVLPDDLFATADVYMEFNSVGCDPKIQQKSLSSAQGFSVNATSPDYGQLWTENSGNFTTVANKTLGIWKIFVPQNSSTEEDGVNIIVFTLKTKDKTGNYKLDIYDGATTRDGPMKNNSFDVEMWSRTNSLIVVYKIEDISKPAAEITISYAIKSCNKSMKCENGICMHPDWKCDGKNDCGDYSDEKNCESVPVMPTSGPTTTPTSAPSTSGVSPTAFGVTIIFMLALGAVLAIVTPMVYRKVRNGQYSQFRDVSVIE